MSKLCPSTSNETLGENTNYTNAHEEQFLISDTPKHLVLINPTAEDINSATADNPETYIFIFVTTPGGIGFIKMGDVHDMNSPYIVWPIDLSGVDQSELDSAIKLVVQRAFELEL